MKTPSHYTPCFLCPRNCGINRGDRALEEHGYCGESAALRLACASIHWGEEPPLTGAYKNEPGTSSPLERGGSGTIFVSGCNLGCVFCQNYQISNAKRQSTVLGQIVDNREFARICLTLQEKGAENINIVTGSHAVPALTEGTAAAKAEGLTIPVLWNSSAYELPGTLELLRDTVDIFLPDLKTLDKTIAGQYFNAPDYPEIAAAAIGKMIAMRPLALTEKLMQGVMVRHLILPGHLEASRDVLHWFADNCAGKALLSLMFQYTPQTQPSAVRSGPVVGPNRYISELEYETVLDWLHEFGIEDGYCQELVPGNTDWLPDFEKTNPFPSDLSVPVWHWKTGFTHMA